MKFVKYFSSQSDRFMAHDVDEKNLCEAHCPGTIEFNEMFIS